MSEVEKMYRAAKVVPSHHYCNDCKYDMSAECPIRCPDDVAVYPPFTAEKQLKLIEFFISSVWWLNLKSLDKTLDYPLNFENKLAKLVNRLWQEFTKEQQQQVKGILE